MEFTVKRNELLSELNLVQGVVERRSTIPILSNILMEAAGDRLAITATDLDVSICCGCPAVVVSEGTMTVSARRVFDVVRLLPEEVEIQFALLENDWVELRSGNSEYKVVGLPKENFPSIPEAAPMTVSIPGGVLKAMIQRTMFAITQEESRYSLNGALMILTPQEIRMVATDGHRLAVVAKPMDFAQVEGEIRALIPRKTLIEIQKLIGEGEAEVSFGRDENHLFFNVSGKKLVSRILAGQFPNYEMVIPRENDKKIVASARALSDSIRRAAVMSDEKLKAVRLSINPGLAEVTASSAEAGEGRELVSVEYDGQALEVGFNPLYLLDFFAVCGAESVVLSLRDAETQGMLQPSGAPDLEYSYIVMPMKF